MDYEEVKNSSSREVKIPKRIIPLAIIIIASVLLIIVLLSFYFFYGNKHAEYTFPSCENIANLSEKNACNTQNIFFYAQRDNNKTFCTFLNSSFWQEKCENAVITSRIASKGDSIEGCEVIKNITAQTLCKDLVYKQKAINQSSEILCESIRDIKLQLSCKDLIRTKILNSAVTQKNESVCYGINNPQSQQTCIDVVKRDKTISEAQTQKNDSLCYTLNNSQSKQICIDIIKKDRAITDKNSSLCNEIITVGIKGICISQTKI